MDYVCDRPLCSQGMRVTKVDASQISLDNLLFPLELLPGVLSHEMIKNTYLHLEREKTNLPHASPGISFKNKQFSLRDCLHYQVG